MMKRSHERLETPLWVKIGTTLALGSAATSLGGCKAEQATADEIKPTTIATTEQKPGKVEASLDLSKPAAGNPRGTLGSVFEIPADQKDNKVDSVSQSRFFAQQSPETQKVLLELDALNPTEFNNLPKSRINDMLMYGEFSRLANINETRINLDNNYGWNEQANMGIGKDTGLMLREPQATDTAQQAVDQWKWNFASANYAVNHNPTPFTESDGSETIKTNPNARTKVLKEYVNVFIPWVESKYRTGVIDTTEKAEVGQVQKGGDGYDKWTVINEGTRTTDSEGRIVLKDVQTTQDSDTGTIRNQWDFTLYTHPGFNRVTGEKVAVNSWIMTKVTDLSNGS